MVSRMFITEMDRQPDRLLMWIGPFDAMPQMRRDLDIIARAHDSGFGFALEKKPDCRATIKVRARDNQDERVFRGLR